MLVWNGVKACLLSKPDCLQSKHVLAGAKVLPNMLSCFLCWAHVCQIKSDRPAGDRKSPPDQALMHCRLILPEYCNWPCFAQGKYHNCPAKHHVSTVGETLNKLRSP